MKYVRTLPLTAPRVGQKANVSFFVNKLKFNQTCSLLRSFFELKLPAAEL